MLGRLRMDVNQCIQEYYIICNRIFRPHKYIGLYDEKKFVDAINGVIRKHCKCHPGGQCPHPHTHYLRQYDYLEFDEDDRNDPEHAGRINGTCRVYVCLLLFSSTGILPCLSRIARYLEDFAQLSEMFG
jgi:hypothetical protein